MRGERVGLIQHQVQRIPVPVVQPFREIGHEPPRGGLGQGGQVQYRGDAFVDDQVGEQHPGGLGQRQVGVITPEDDHRQPFGGAVGGAAQPPPHPDRVDEQ